MQTAKAEFDEHRARGEVMKAELAKLIEALPDNQNIKRIYGGRFTAFTVTMADVAKNKHILCPFYYDFKAQYKEIADRIRKSAIENLQGLINAINTKEKNRFHPNVIKTINEMWGCHDEKNKT